MRTFFSSQTARRDVSTDSSHKGFVMKSINTALVISILLFSTSGMAMDKTAAGAVAGAAIGAATGKDLKSTVGGAVVGAGTGAMFKNGDKGKAARKGGAVGAVVGAGAAAVTGNSVLKGAAVGAGSGALIGEATH
jgi:hypothetical protein